MSKCLIISDLHNRVGWIEAFLESKKGRYDKVIFLGDYFDQFHDGPQQVMNVANWLKHSLTQPNRVHLFGNHDMPYAFPENIYMECPGWTPMKSFAVNKIMTREDWDKLQLVEFHEGYTISHAGFHPQAYGHPLEAIMTEERIQTCCDEAMDECRENNYSKYLDQGSRMGSNFRGGCTWLDWGEFVDVEGIKQITGHTPDDYVRQEGASYCMDTHNNHIGVIEDGVFSYYTLNAK